jgi:chemotaxis protein MotB
MAGKGGGAWKVAYADFVTAMMAFFMVMWLTSQKPEVKQAVAGYFRDPYAIFQGTEPGSAADGTPTTDPRLGHQAPPQRRHVENPGNETDYKFTVLFADAAAEIDAAAAESIRTFVPAMIGKLNRIEVRAHCESKPLPEGSPFKDLLDLCYARGRAVQSELENRGIEHDRIRISLAGANEPVAANLTEDELKLNSRVDVIMLPDLVDVPWHETTHGNAEGNAPAAGDAAPHENAHQDDPHDVVAHEEAAHDADTHGEASHDAAPHAEPDHGEAHDAGGHNNSGDEAAEHAAH